MVDRAYDANVGWRPPSPARGESRPPAVTARNNREPRNSRRRPDVGEWRTGCIGAAHDPIRASAHRPRGPVRDRNGFAIHNATDAAQLAMVQYKECNGDEWANDAILLGPDQVWAEQPATGQTFTWP